MSWRNFYNLKTMWGSQMATPHYFPVQFLRFCRTPSELLHVIYCAIEKSMA